MGVLSKLHFEVAIHKQASEEGIPSQKSGLCTELGLEQA